MVGAASMNGMRAVVFNSRGTSDGAVTSPQFYSASYTGDMRSASSHCNALLPHCVAMVYKPFIAMLLEPLYDLEPALPVAVMSKAPSCCNEPCLRLEPCCQASLPCPLGHSTQASGAVCMAHSTCQIHSHLNTLVRCTRVVSCRCHVWREPRLMNTDQCLPCLLSRRLASTLGRHKSERC